MKRGRPSRISTGILTAKVAGGSVSPSGYSKTSRGPGKASLPSFQHGTLGSCMMMMMRMVRKVRMHVCEACVCVRATTYAVNPITQLPRAPLAGHFFAPVRTAPVNDTQLLAQNSRGQIRAWSCYEHAYRSRNWMKREVLGIHMQPGQPVGWGLLAPKHCRLLCG